MSEAPTDFISSDILEDQFGPTTLQILQQDETERLICTATSAGQILELSWVRFDPAGIAVFPQVHKAVTAGKSMGKVFRDHNVSFRRCARSIRKCPADKLPANMSGLFDATGTATVVEVSILAGDSGVPYADILEVYSPEVSWPQTGSPIDEAANNRLQQFGNRLV